MVLRVLTGIEMWDSKGSKILSTLYQNYGSFWDKYQGSVLCNHMGTILRRQLKAEKVCLFLVMFLYMKKRLPLLVPNCLCCLHQYLHSFKELCIALHPFQACRLTERWFSYLDNNILQFTKTTIFQTQRWMTRPNARSKKITQPRLKFFGPDPSLLLWLL